LPVATERSDEFDDHARDEQQPEDEQREAQDFEEQGQLGDLTPGNCVTFRPTLIE
jgi:hypothetical protein